jgi:tetratricopeptide (TPR) repeat protein
MKSLFFCLILPAIIVQSAAAQSSDKLNETAKDFMRQGDYSNAILVLNRSLQQNPQNTDAGKDLALSYFYKGDYTNALQVITPLADREDADDQVFQIAGSIYKQLGNVKEGEKIYKKGLDKFPSSGPLYNELGELQAKDKNSAAIKTWEKGIQKDPSFSKNYYNAARFYFFSTDKIWSILYGEMFINMDPAGSNTPQMKQLLMESYKKLFSEPDLDILSKDKNKFEKNYLNIMNRQTGAVSGGLNAEVLAQVRIKFILDWFAVPKPPAFRLFEYQQQLLKSGMFEAYNQWLFGASENLATYEKWISKNTAEYDAFTELQKSRIFKVPAGQYYK